MGCLEKFKYVVIFEVLQIGVYLSFIVDIVGF